MRLYGVFHDSSSSLSLVTRTIVDYPTYRPLRPSYRHRLSSIDCSPDVPTACLFRLVTQLTISCDYFTRLAFVTLRNNLMVLSLRAMIVQFVALMLIAAFCFGGFLYALWTFVCFISYYLESNAEEEMTTNQS